VIGWSGAGRLDRLPMLAGNQRFCVLPAGRPHLASAVLARSLARLPGDYLELHNQIVLAVETFTDPARHTGACYAAAGFACAGSTKLARCTYARSSIPVTMRDRFAWQPARIPAVRYAWARGRSVGYGRASRGDVCTVGLRAWPGWLTDV
jgi:Domain of unknown function (DUF4338)